MSSSNYGLTSKLLGSGISADVFLGFEKNTRTPVAVKMFKPQLHNPETNKAAEQETDILRTLKDTPDVIHLIEDISRVQNYQGRDVQERCQVFELVDGYDLCTIYNKLRFGSLTEASRELTAKIIFYKLVTVVEQVHRMNIAHLDIKLENIMCNILNGKMTLVDFGFAEKFDPKNPVSLSRRAGSFEYCAPEIFYTDCIYDGTKADTWSLGVVLYVLLFAKFPFAEQPTAGTTTICDIPQWVSQEARDLIIKLLQMDAYERPSTSEILQHSWFAPFNCQRSGEKRNIDVFMKELFCKMVKKTKERLNSTQKSQVSKRNSLLGVKAVPMKMK